MTHKALVIEKNDNEFSTHIKQIDTPTISNNEILIKVTYSSLNYKDALSSIGNSGVSRNFPHVTGIDAIGDVCESKSDDISVGDKVLVTGFDLGMNTSGGHQEYLKVPSSWAIKVSALKDEDYMNIGTAGFTAGLSVDEIVSHNVKPQDGDILVSGASGGVGSVSVAMLSQRGYSVTAISGKREKEDFLKSIGAKNIIDRKSLEIVNKKFMLPEQYAAMIDTVGGVILSESLKSLKYNGIATCCGLTSSFQLNSSVFPFILRGIRLVGIDSVNCNIQKRKKIWKDIESIYDIKSLHKLGTVISLEDIPSYYKLFLSGKISGRIIVKIS